MILLTTLHAQPCENLKRLKLPHSTITEAKPIPDGTCQVEATLTPSPDSDIKITLWLPPVATWNHKYLAVGNGGWSGSINLRQMEAPLRRGYATSSTDTGHQGSSASFALGHPEKLADFAWRSEHEMTVKSKAILAAYYGNAAQLSYWQGCSAGGKQAMKEAQRFPQDFDGIIAGSPGLDWVARANLSMWVAQAVHKDEASFIPAAKFRLIHEAALTACDAADGLADGIIEDPTRCHFDPKSIECHDANTETCLTAPQVEAVRKIYAGPGPGIAPGLSPGGELGWATYAGPRPFSIGFDYFKYVVFQDPNWDFQTLKFNDDRKKDPGDNNATNPDLSAFAKRGGKLIQYHGWSDPQIPPASSVAYYQSALQKMGPSTPTFYRLFMIPGMAHCGGGEGVNTFDMLSALEQWVEHNTAPSQIPASRKDRTRPLCPYPQQARYKGSGNPDEASNFTCASPRPKEP